MYIKPIKGIKGEVKVPGDKSISHRAIMLASLGEGESHIYNFLMAHDCISTINCFREMGVPIRLEKKKVTVQGLGLRGLKEPSRILDVGNSGTSIRLISGILAGQDFTSVITGDESIENRPMDRIIDPLEKMGASIVGLKKDNFAPLKIEGRSLRAIDYRPPVASAQVKSAILLASLYGNGETNISEIARSRDHTERMLNYMGGDVKVRGLNLTSRPVDKLIGREIYVPGDISSAAFFLVLGALGKDNEILVKNIGLNPTRTGIIQVLRDMGGNIEVLNKSLVNGEPLGDLYIKGSQLRGVEIGGDIIPSLIDEIPIIAVGAALAKGRTVISDAEELKVKESNRIKAVVRELGKIGANIEETRDGMIIHGRDSLKGGEVESYGDHRMAMALSIAGLVSDEGVSINDTSCVDISFPGFFNILDRMMKNGK